MLRILQLLFLGHFHKWKTIETRDFYTTSMSGRVVGRGRRYIQQCEHCGKAIKRDFI